MIELTCEHCHQPFKGRPNRKTCSVACRRTLEGKRRVWDRLFAGVAFCEINANSEWITAAQRAYWQKEADSERTKLVAEYGPRP